MIKLIGECKMLITRLIVRGLHGYINYNVPFNENITFLYGENGCGKTTILNIVSSIVTGRIFDLSNYNFESIRLEYQNKKPEYPDERLGYQDERSEYKDRLLEDYSIYLRKQGSDLYIEFNGKEYKILDFDMFAKDKENIDDLQRSFFFKYEFAEQIRNTFNYIYLPLNRNCMEYQDEKNSLYKRRLMYFDEAGNSYNNYLNESLNYITNIVRDSCARISILENNINSSFRKDVLTTSLKVTSELNFPQIIKEINRTNWDSISKKKNDYIKTIKEIGEWNSNTQNQIESFFSKFKNLFENLNTDKNNLSFELLLYYSEFNKISQIADLAKSVEGKKEFVERPKTEFLYIINEFLHTGQNDKSVYISSEGKISFFSKFSKKPIGINDLSSGEKHLIIIFANLIFGLSKKSAGIYIIDEPESSLHLIWQKMFVESILRVNENLQLIFATHSPEIISQYNDKTVRIIKTNDRSSNGRV